VKPFDDERFDEAFQRARRMARLEEASRLRDMLLAVLQETGGQAPTLRTPTRAGGRGGRGISSAFPSSRAGSPLHPGVGHRLHPGQRPYAELVVGNRKHLIREAMQNLENQLDPARFFRVHRSAIVQLDRVDAMLKAPSGDCDVQLTNA